MSEKNPKESMEQFEIKFVKPVVGKIITGEVVEILDESRLILVNLDAPTEGRIYLEHFSEDKNIEKFSDVVKLGDKVEAQITKYVEGEVLLLSRLPLLRGEKLEQIKQTLVIGNRITGVIKEKNQGGIILKYSQYEIFVPFGNLDYAIKNDFEKFVNTKLEVVILKISERRNHLNILATRKPIIDEIRHEEQLKRQQHKEEDLTKIKAGDILDATIIRIDKHSASARITDYVIGQIRISQVSHLHVEKIEDLLQLGQVVKVKVLKKEGNRLDLSIKALIDTPYIAFQKQHNVGDTVEGVVFQKLPIGIIIEVAPGVRGLLHKSEFSWNLNDNFDTYVKIGDKLQLKIISFDLNKERISLSKKALEDNPWKNVTIKKHDITKALVEEVLENGLKVRVQGVLGDIELSELALEKGKPADYYAVGDEIEVVCIYADRRTWELKLSVKQVKEKAAQKEYKKFMNQQEEEDTSMTIGDFLDSENIK